MKMRFWIGVLCFSVVLAASSAYGQDGATLYKDHCAICHEAGTSSDTRAPGRDVLGQMTPEQILQTLEKGAMKAQAAERSRAQRLALAEYLSGKPFSTEPANPIPKSAYCSADAGKFSNSLDGAAWNGWGVTVTNSRF